MKVNKETAEKIWYAYFGDVENAEDAFGMSITRDAHGLDEENGWTVDHIWPKHPESDGNILDGANILDNVQPLHWNCNLQKSNNLQGSISFDDNSKIAFTISRVGKYEGKAIGRMKVQDEDGHFDWGYYEPNF